MQDMSYLQGEVLSRKEYLKKKKIEKTKKTLKGISPRTWFLLVFILIISVYIIHQFYIYNTKHRLVQTLPEEISSMKDYNIYYVSETYAYDAENQLKSMSTTSSDKLTIDEGLGISNITVKNNIVYGIKSGSLLKIDTTQKEIKSEVLIENNVKGYTIYNDEVYVYMSGEGVNAGVYSLDKKNKTELIISGGVQQLLVDNNNIYIVDKNKNIVRYKKDGEGAETLVSNSSSASLVQDERYIYFVNTKDSNMLYRIEKSSKKTEKVSKTGTLSAVFVGMNGSSFMGVYDGTVYYINTKDSNKLYKSNVSEKEDRAVLEDSIQILDVIDSTIFYKVKNDIGVYRYDIVNGISSQVTSARVLEFDAEE